MMNFVFILDMMMVVVGVVGKNFLCSISRSINLRVNSRVRSGRIRCFCMIVLF